jgi:hypothetical protein
MPDFAAFFASGQVAELMVAVLFVGSLGAAGVLVAHRARPAAAIGDSPGAAGVFFALALRAALTGAWWGFVSLAMTAAFFAHAWDLWRRWRD